jgi:class 3 adenylate cyclase
MSVETLTFLFTDIEGSTALLRRLGDNDYGRVLADHQALIRAALAAHDGKEVDTQGDAFFAVFSWPTACVAAVIEMQRALEARAWPGGEHVRVRMGVHTGEAVTTAIGRDREMGEVRALVESRRLVTLTGAGGSGKTRLALQVAAELLDGSGEGVWLAELAAVSDGDTVPAAITEALGIGEQPGRAVLDRLLDALAF